MGFTVALEFEGGLLKRGVPVFPVNCTPDMKERKEKVSKTQIASNERNREKYEGCTAGGARSPSHRRRISDMRPEEIGNRRIEEYELALRNIRPWSFFGSLRQAPMSSATAIQCPSGSSSSRRNRDRCEHVQSAERDLKTSERRGNEEALVDSTKQRSSRFAAPS